MRWLQNSIKNHIRYATTTRKLMLHTGTEYVRVYCLLAHK